MQIFLKNNENQIIKVEVKIKKLRRGGTFSIFKYVGA